MFKLGKINKIKKTKGACSSPISMVQSSFFNTENILSCFT
jgi:hypothetical protein